MTLITTLGAASCVPLQDLDDYRKPGAGGLPPAGPAGDPGAEEANEPPAAGSAGASASEGPIVPSGPLSGVAGASGNGQLGGETTPDPEALERIDGGAGGAGAADAAPQGPCLTGERLGPNGSCYLVDATLATWSAAREACLARGEGWDLGSVRSAADAEFLGELITFEVWIGASDAANEGEWVWINDAQPFWLGGVDGVAADGAYTNWNATEPNGATTTNCARALPPGPGISSDDAPWADLDCAQLRGAVCEGPR